MNKQRSFSEQMFQFLILAIGGMWLFQTFFNRQKPTDAVPPRPALTLMQAFKGIDPAQGPTLSQTAAIAEEKKLKAAIDKNPQDALADWSRLRVALIQQYVLKDLDSKTRKSGFMGLGPMAKYFPAYDEIITRAKGDAVEAQAIYQSGDLLWRQSIQNGGKPSQEAANGLESLVHKGRGSSAFLDNQILVPKEVDPAKVLVGQLPPGGFKLAKVRDLRGTLSNPNPQGLPDRLLEYYSTKPLFRLFDSVVNLFGANPAFSYGLAVLFFAVLTRCAVQPLTRRQYDSMKGMAVIAPEMKKIQEKYKGKTEGDAQVKMMKEIRALQQRHGVNPMLGCGLAALQMPVFFLFVSPLIQNYEPKMELASASFLWISSLARPDIPLLVLYGISMFFSFRLSSTPPTDDMQRQQQMIMSFAMPFIFPFFIISFPAAFTMYWMTYNAVSTVFQWRMMKAADPKKNVIKTLMGSDLKVANSTADAVPARPNGEKALESGEGFSNGNGNSNGNSHASSNGSTNGSANGSMNGKSNSAASGIVLTPLDKNGQNPEQKKKRKR
ncbi:membrane protein insertase, YidC/Oxa1 family, C-terminal domain-containing protein [Abditibacterium utsteinense]|uniref:Membrane protein insertase, YidC/Oxa1 family, C-terminal domain-containing protein n=1 Tax=Abditibacterium utsteinense TaxID=1960156 RepID=A0A2S8SSL5_9BACT|nr:membrane protein insertase YidC [Abditibacterium utsteinense]PQV63791.1 membrane protein insertase, YidC/Oxa1 family, C-terminal domain-containing protein [Abditibacterium utsteinense]